MSGAPLVIDRIEGELAVVEVLGERVHIPVAALPPGAKEGSALRLALANDDTLDQEKARLRRLRARGPQDDDITL